jgi:transposase
MAKRRIKSQPEARRPKGLSDGQRAEANGGKRLVTHQVGPIPIINRILQRMHLQDFLKQHLPTDDKRTKVDSARVVLLLIRNVLISREPIYGVTEWASNYGPDLFDLWPDQLEHLNDDRVGRCLDRVFGALDSNLIMDVVTHVVREFDLSLDELHNDSTTVTLTGKYADAASPTKVDGLDVPAITWGHNKDHRPDLKQLLYILTVTNDGGVPIYFQAASGNTADDQTHQTTWKLMAQLVQRTDFIYVADCKLASTANMNEIARLNGRFITVLPTNRKENTQFRKRLRETPDSIEWKEVYRITNEDGTVRDVFRTASQEYVSKEGYRLLWFHSRGKAESDVETRTRQLQRAECELTELLQRVMGPRTRFRSKKKIQAAVDEILKASGMQEFLQVQVEETEEQKFRQVKRGRPNDETKYTRYVVKRFELKWQIDNEQMAIARASDGVFPLISNVPDWKAEQILQAYKRQPIIEKRFSQLKTDFRVAPVYLKSGHRIVGLLAVYFFALMVQALIERELRNAMASSGAESLPLYPEGRACRRPTTRQVFDVFEPLQRHTLFTTKTDEFTTFTTELSPIHTAILKLLRIPLTTYRDQS